MVEMFTLLHSHFLFNLLVSTYCKCQWGMCVCVCVGVGVCFFTLWAPSCGEHNYKKIGISVLNAWNKYLQYDCDIEYIYKIFFPVRWSSKRTIFITPRPLIYNYTILDMTSLLHICDIWVLCFISVIFLLFFLLRSTNKNSSSLSVSEKQCKQNRNLCKVYIMFIIC